LERKDFVYILRKRYPDVLIVGDSSCVQMKGLRFEFSRAGMLMKIKMAYYDER